MTKKKAAKRGRPILKDSEKKHNRTLRLSDEVWKDLLDRGNGRAARGIEAFISLSISAAAMANEMEKLGLIGRDIVKKYPEISEI